MNVKNITKTGPKPERVRSDKNWKDAITDAMKKKRPKGGWPEPEKGKKKE